MCIRDRMDIIEIRITGDFKEDVRTLIMNKIMIDEMGETTTTDDNRMITEKNIEGPEVVIEIGTYSLEIHQITLREPVNHK